MLSRNYTKAFTLIELLIVVAIIAILAAIAVPNFMEAQTRSKVSRAKSDMRSLKTALESYRVDNNNYPNHKAGTNDDELAPLTSPIAYITSIPKDPFKIGKTGDLVNYADNYEYVRLMKNGDVIDVYNYYPTMFAPPSYNYFLMSVGPDKKQEIYYIYSGITFSFSEHSYDPTNGTVSDGEIYDFGSGLTNQ